MNEEKHNNGKAMKQESNGDYVVRNGWEVLYRGKDEAKALRIFNS